MEKGRLFVIARVASTLTLATSLFATSSFAAARAEHQIITDTPVRNLKVEVEDMPSDSGLPHQRIQLHVTGDVVLPSGDEVSVDRTEAVVPVAIKDVPSALSMTQLFRDGTTVIARERISDGGLFTIGHINDDQELVLDSKYQMQVVYRQYRYTLHDRIVGAVLGTDTKDSDSVLVDIISN